MTDITKNEIGTFIAACRKEKKLTQKQLGEKLNVTDRAVSKWETGPLLSRCEPYGAPLQRTGHFCQRASGREAFRAGAVPERDGENAHGLC